MNDFSRRLVGRRAFVTGGGSGIGRASAIRLAAEGAHVAVADKRGPLAEETTAQIKDAGGHAIALTCDVGVETEIEAAVQRAAKSLGGLDSVFANAGTASAGWIHELTLLRSVVSWRFSFLMMPRSSQGVP